MIRGGEGFKGRGGEGEHVTILVTVNIMSIILRLKTKKEALQKRYMGVTGVTTYDKRYNRYGYNKEGVVCQGS